MICDYCGLETAPLNYHEGAADCRAALLEARQRNGLVAHPVVDVVADIPDLPGLSWLWLALGAAAFALLLAVGHLLGAPAPAGPKGPSKAPAPLGPITVAELLRVNVVHWGGNAYPVSFQRDGHYWCSDLTDGTGRVWQGPWQLVGSDVVLDESSAWVAPDAPPTLPGGPHTHKLELRRPRPGEMVPAGVRIVGRGWGGEIQLEAR